MAFTVEDGSVVAGANAYITAAELVAYWADRGVTLSASTAEQEAAIVVATQYVDLNNNWAGGAVSSAQALDWPRYGTYDERGFEIADNVIPQQLKNAIAEYAYRQLTAELQPDPGDTGAVKRQRDKVDVIESETEYQDGTGGYYGLRSYPMADNYLKSLTNGGIGGNFGRVGLC